VEEVAAEGEAAALEEEEEEEEVGTERRKGRGIVSLLLD
jgi:hypothetical protein